MGGVGFRRFSAVANHSSVAKRMAAAWEELKLISFLVWPFVLVCRCGCGCHSS